MRSLYLSHWTLCLKGSKHTTELLIILARLRKLQGYRIQVMTKLLTSKQGLLNFLILIGFLLEHLIKLRVNLILINFLIGIFGVKLLLWQMIFVLVLCVVKMFQSNKDPDKYRNKADCEEILNHFTVTDVDVWNPICWPIMWGRWAI